MQTVIMKNRIGHGNSSKVALNFFIFDSRRIPGRRISSAEMEMGSMVFLGDDSSGLGEGWVDEGRGSIASIRSIEDSRSTLVDGRGKDSSETLRSERSSGLNEECEECLSEGPLLSSSGGLFSG